MSDKPEVTWPGDEAVEKAVNGPVCVDTVETLAAAVRFLQAEAERYRLALEKAREAVERKRPCFLKKGDEHLWDRDMAVRAKLRQEILAEWPSLSARQPKETR